MVTGVFTARMNMITQHVSEDANTTTDAQHNTPTLHDADKMY